MLGSALQQSGLQSLLMDHLGLAPCNNQSHHCHIEQDHDFAYISCEQLCTAMTSDPACLVQASFMGKTPFPTLEYRLACIGTCGQQHLRSATVRGKLSYSTDQPQIVHMTAFCIAHASP